MALIGYDSPRYCVGGVRSRLKYRRLVRERLGYGIRQGRGKSYSVGFRI